MLVVRRIPIHRGTVRGDLRPREEKLVTEVVGSEAPAKSDAVNVDRERGYRRMVLHFNQLAELLRGNTGAYSSALPDDIEVLHVIEESRQPQAVTVVLSSSKWGPHPEGSEIPTIWITFQIHREVGCRLRLAAITMIES